MINYHVILRAIFYKHENNVQTRGRHTSKWGKKRYETIVIGRQEKEKKYEIWYFSQVAIKGLSF